MQLNTDRRQSTAAPCSAITNSASCLQGEVGVLVLDCLTAAAAVVWGRCVSTHTCTVDVYSSSPSPSIKNTVCRGFTPTHTLIHVHVPHWSWSFGTIAFKTGCARIEGEQTASYIRMHLLQREASSMYGCMYVCMQADFIQKPAERCQSAWSCALFLHFIFSLSFLHAAAQVFTCILMHKHMIHKKQHLFYSGHLEWI